ncbi:MAG: heme NO-binding domain-containing protein [Paracoccaceae bacterium]
MHGLINRALENFLKERHGQALWQRVVQRACLPFDSFEPLLTYDIAIIDAVISAACAELDRPRDTVLEDMGTALVSHRARDGLRRLLRFGGVGFRDFLYSLEELPDRARLALPDLNLPDMRLEDRGAGCFALVAAPPFAGAGFILIGLLRAMADDYGALVLLDMAPPSADGDVILIHLLDEAHAEGRRFDLAVGAA